MDYSVLMRKLIVITAPRNRGKTTWLWELKSQLEKKKENSIGGFITELQTDGAEKKKYILVNQDGGEKLVMATDNPPLKNSGWFLLGKRYWFSMDTFEKTFETYSNSGQYTHVFMDEAGLLELEGSGFASSIEWLMNNYEGTLIIAVRDIFVEDFLAKFRFRENWKVEIDGPSAEV